MYYNQEIIDKFAGEPINDYYDNEYGVFKKVIRHMRVNNYLGEIAMKYIYESQRSLGNSFHQSLKRGVLRLLKIVAINNYKYGRAQAHSFLVEKLVEITGWKGIVVFNYFSQNGFDNVRRFPEDCYIEDLETKETKNEPKKEIERKETYENFVERRDLFLDMFRKIIKERYKTHKRAAANIGISRSEIGHITAGKRLPTNTSSRLIADKLGIELESIPTTKQRNATIK